MSDPTDSNYEPSSVVEIKPNRSRIAENDDGVNEVPPKLAKINNINIPDSTSSEDIVEVLNKETPTTNGNLHLNNEINQEVEEILNQDEDEDFVEDDLDDELNDLNDSNTQDLTEDASTDMDEYIHNNLSVIEDCQSTIDKLNQEANEEILKVEHKYNKLRSPIYKRRDEFILKIPNFWLSVFSKHPQLKRVMTKDDLKCLVHLKSLQIEDFEEKRSGYSIKFYFSENPYFYNEVVTKEYHLPWHDAPSCECNEIRWKAGMDLTKLQNPSSFFSWFCPQDDASTDDIAEIIKDELWPNPLQCYLMNKDGDSDTEESDEDDDEGEAVYINDDSAEYISSDDGEQWHTAAQGKDGPSKDEFYVIDDDDDDDLEDGGILSDDDELVVDKTDDFVDLRHDDEQLRHHNDDDELVDLDATDDVIDYDDDVVYSDDVIDSDTAAEKLSEAVAADERLTQESEVTGSNNDVTSTSDLDAAPPDVDDLSTPSEVSFKEVSQESTISQSPT